MNLRDLEKNGERVLQEKIENRMRIDTGFSSHPEYNKTQEFKNHEWRDIPTVKEEKSVVITEDRFNAIIRNNPLLIPFRGKADCYDYPKWVSNIKKELFGDKNEN